MLAAVTSDAPRLIRPEPRAAASQFPTPNRPFVVDDDVSAGLQPAPLPAGWVLRGNPDPHMRRTSISANGDLESGIWTCGRGMFRFDYDFDEFVHVISGSAVVRSDGGELLEELRAGSTALFPRGLSTVWTVDDHIHKYYAKRNRPRVVRIARRMTDRLRGANTATSSL